MKVMFLALTSVRAAAVARQCAFLLDLGVDTSVVTADPEGWAAADVALDGRVDLVSLADGESRLLLRRMSGLGAPRGSGGLRTIVAKAHRRVILPGYRVLRPYLLWRVARRDLLRDLDPAALSEVVVVDAQAVPLGWRIARRFPDLKVSLSLDRTAYLPPGAEGVASESAEA